MVPIITLFMVIGLERNYVEQLKEEQTALLDRRGAVHKTISTGEGTRSRTVPTITEKYLDPKFSAINNVAQNNKFSQTEGISPSPELYEQLKNRKKI